MNGDVRWIKMKNGNFTFKSPLIRNVLSSVNTFQSVNHNLKKGNYALLEPRQL